MKLKKEFSDFYSVIRIDVEQEPLREKREILEAVIKNRFPGILQEHGIYSRKSDIRVIDQGSYKYNTTIKSDVFDRDVAIIVPLDTSKIGPYDAKKALYDSIDISSRTVVIKEPCVRAIYTENGQEKFHIDLPLYAEDEYGNKFLSRGKKTTAGIWEPADPDGLNNDLCNKINGNDQLRRVICFVKKWKNEKYKNAQTDHEIPPSIGLTYLVCDCFTRQVDSGEENDLRALYLTMKGIRDSFSVGYDYSGNVVSADIHRFLPVKPYTDVFSKIRNYSDRYLLNFYNRISDAVVNLNNAMNVDADHDAAIYVRKVLGEEFSVPDKQATNASTNAKKEHSFG